MKEQLEKRLTELKAEFAAGQKMLVELNSKQTELQSTMLRISGAVQVLEEMVAAQNEVPKTSVSAMNKESRALLLDILGNIEDAERISITLEPMSRDVTIVYDDCDDEWFKELLAAQPAEE